MASMHLHLKEGQYERNLLFLMRNFLNFTPEFGYFFSSNTYSYLLHFVAYMLGAKISLDENNVQ